jgi:hypothetical protein
MKCSPKFYYALGDTLSRGASLGFAGRMATLYGAVPTRLDDGAALITSITRRQLPDAPHSSHPGVVTVMAGWNDFMRFFSSQRAVTRSDVKDIVGLYRSMLHAVLKRLPCATVIVSTIPDPTGGTGKLDRWFETSAFPKFACRELTDLNDGIRLVAEDEDRVLLADVHGWLLGLPWCDSKFSLNPTPDCVRQIENCWLDAYVCEKPASYPL